MGIKEGHVLDAAPPQFFFQGTPMVGGVLRLVWVGLWQGFGVELSFFVLWIGWHFLHKRMAHKFDPEHFIHRVHSYFTD